MTDARARRSAQTEPERRLWSILRGRQLDGAKFRRQHPLGPTVLDFACVEHRLVTEAGGGQHADSEHDGRRTAWLEACGWRVIRFWNNEILENTEGVLIAIQQALKENPRPRAGRPGMAAFDPTQSLDVGDAARRRSPIMQAYSCTSFEWGHTLRRCATAPAKSRRPPMSVGINL